jgi:signal transduction histidine kinase
MVTDITAAKEGEAAIRDSEERLRATHSNLQAMVEAERKHVAREVHDELGQILTALRMETSLLQHELHGQKKSLARVDEMRQLIESMFKSVRSIAGNLRPSTLDLGLVPAIEWLAGDFEKRWQVDCALDIDPRDIQASDAYATAVFRVIQESLTNVARHAQASRVSISLQQSPDGMHLEIHDNGCGFDNGKERTSGFGMIGMRERVLELGGVLRVQTALAHGTTIFIDLPLAEVSSG